MNDITAITTEVFALDDRAKADFERLKAEREERERRKTLVYKDFLGEQPPMYEAPPAPEISPTLVRAIGMALSEERAANKKRQQDGDNELSSRIDDLEARVDDVETRLDALEGNGVGALKYLDGNLKPCDVDDAKFARVERLLKIIRKGGSGYAG